MKTPQTKNELNKVCCEACYNAIGPDCDCRCHGAYHGLGNLNNPKKPNKPKRKVNMALGPEDIFLTEEQAAPFRFQIRDRECCRNAFHDETNLKDEPIRAYPHSDGWKIQGLPGSWWLFIKCPSCGYDWSIWKLGVERDFDSLEAVAK